MPTEPKVARRADGKKKRGKRKKQKSGDPKRNSVPTVETPAEPIAETDVVVDYIPEKPMFDLSNPSYAQFSVLFQDVQDSSNANDNSNSMRDHTVEDEEDEDEFVREKMESKDKQLSVKKMKRLNRPSVAQLKQRVDRPDLVELHDTASADPKLLIHLKGTRNTVPVPRHWCHKRKYLQGKRGIEKKAYDLPDFIKRTGIMEMRAALQEKEEKQGLASKMREKIRPKMGKLDIDYQKLHDAFFRWQTKPRMTKHGHIYYEGKEFEADMTERKPGELSEELKQALGMPTGKDVMPVPPPWLLHMQRFGPPPSYPNLKIPGLNAPIPPGAQFGYHPGGWGKPPIDEYGRPLYGDVFGTANAHLAKEMYDLDIDKSLWGKMESESEESSEDEEEEDSSSSSEEEAEGPELENEEEDESQPSADDFNLRKTQVEPSTAPSVDETGMFSISKSEAPSVASTATPGAESQPRIKRKKVGDSKADLSKKFKF